MIAADADLRIVFELVESKGDALPVRLAEALVATVVAQGGRRSADVGPG